MKSSIPSRRLVVSRQLVSHEGSDGLLPVLPNRQAARSLGVSYRSLEGLAKRVIQVAGLRLAPKLIARRELRKAASSSGTSHDAAGFARSLEPTLRELLRAGVEFETLGQVREPRVARLARVALEYRRRLRDQGMIDPSELLWEAAKRVDAPRGLYVSGFPRLPAAEREFLDAYAAPGSVIHLPVAEGPLFTENHEAEEDFVRRGWLVEASGSHERSKHDLGHRLAMTFDGRPKEATSAVGRPQVAANAYSDQDAEVRGTLAQVKRLMWEGVPASEISIVARDEEAYGPQLLAVAAEYRLPLRALYQIPLGETRLGRWSSELNESIRTDFPFEVTARLLFHPLVDPLPPGSWDEARKTHPEGADEWARFAESLVDPWPEHGSRQQFVRRLLELLADLGVVRNASRWAREARALEVLTRGLRSLPDQSREIDGATFSSELDELLRLLTVEAAPGRGGVELHTPLSLFGARVEHLFVLGAAEGILPSPVRPDALLDPFEREELYRSGQPVETVAEAARREELSFWALLHSAGSSLTISYPKLVGRTETLPSPFLGRLGLVPQTPPAHPLCSRPEVRRFQLHRHETGSDVTADPVLKRARRALSVESTRESEAAADEHDGVIGVPYQPPATGIGVSRLIDLASCPFKFFASSVLRLSDQEEAASEVDASLTGQLYHLTLHLAMEQARGSADPREAALQALDAALTEAEAELGVAALPTWPLEREQHLLTLRRAVMADDFIGEGDAVEALEADFQANWRGIPVRGRVDRIDLGEHGATLVDYKTGGAVYNLAKDSAGRSKVDLQLPVYREAAAQLVPGREVGRTYYYSVRKAEALRVTEASEEELQRIAEGALAAWKNGNYPVDPDIMSEACRYCDFDSLCRHGPRLERKRSRG